MQSDVKHRLDILQKLWNQICSKKQIFKKKTSNTHKSLHQM